MVKMKKKVLGKTLSSKEDILIAILKSLNHLGKEYYLKLVNHIKAPVGAIKYQF